MWNTRASRLRFLFRSMAVLAPLHPLPLLPSPYSSRLTARSDPPSTLPAHLRIHHLGDPVLPQPHPRLHRPLDPHPRDPHSLPSSSPCNLSPSRLPLHRRARRPPFHPPLHLAPASPLGLLLPRHYLPAPSAGPRLHAGAPADCRPVMGPEGRPGLVHYAAGVQAPGFRHRLPPAPIPSYGRLAHGSLGPRRDLLRHPPCILFPVRRRGRHATRGDRRARRPGLPRLLGRLHCRRHHRRALVAQRGPDLRRQHPRTGCKRRRVSRARLAREERPPAADDRRLHTAVRREF